MFTFRSLGRAAFAAVLALLLVGAAASAASAADRQLSNAGTDDGDCIASPCATLLYVQQQVQAGDTVQLAAGVYPTDPVDGAIFAVDDVTYERSGAGEAQIVLPGNSYGLEVRGAGITFRDLTVTTSDGTIQGDTWAFTYTGSDLTLDRMRVEHQREGVVALEEGGHGITVTDSTFADVAGTAVGVWDGLMTVTGSDITANSGIFVRTPTTLTASGNTFHGNVAGDGGTGIYVENDNVGSTATGNRFSPSLQYAIDGGQTIQAPDNWWGCNAGVEHDGCAPSYALPVESAEPHLVLDVSAGPNPFPLTASSTITARLISSDPESPFTGGPGGSGPTLSTTAGTLDDPHPAFVAGVAQTTLRATVAGFPTVTATLDNGSASTTVQAFVSAAILPATGVSATGATLHATVVPSVSQAQFLYRKAGESAWTAAAKQTVAPGGGSVDTTVGGLDPASVYYAKLRPYPLVDGQYQYSATTSFTTTAGGLVAGDVAVDPPADLTTTGATLGATVDTHGSPVSGVVEWGTTAGDYTRSAALYASGASSARVLSRGLPTQFAPGTTYHYRIAVTNAGGAYTTPDQTFTTVASGAPAVTLGAVDPLTATTATINAVVDAHGAAVTSTLVQLGTTTAYTKAPAPLLSGAPVPGGRAYSRPFANLKPGTTYHYKVTVTTTAGTYEGTDQTFTTQP